jgi:hypothetical protein
MSRVHVIPRIVPSGPTPNKEEWTAHFWYHLITTAAQANAACEDTDARALIAVIQNYHVTLPCTTCKTHYAAYVKEHPFGLEHARDVEKAMDWVLTLREAIAERVIREEREKAQQAAAAAPAAVVPPPRKSCIPKPGSDDLCDEHARAAAVRDQARQLIARIYTWRETNIDCGCNSKKHNWTCVLNETKPAGASKRYRNEPKTTSLPATSALRRHK